MASLTHQNFCFFSCDAHQPSSTATKTPPLVALASADHSCWLVWFHPTPHAREAQFARQPTSKPLKMSLPSL